MNIRKVILTALPMLMLSLSFLTAQPSLATDPGVQIINPLCSGTNCTPKDNAAIYDPRIILGNIIKAAMGFIGAVALILFMYGGLTIMISRGSSDSIKKGKNIMVWAAIGIIIIFSSYAIVSFIIEKIPKTSSSASTSPTQTSVQIEADLLEQFQLAK